MKLVLDEAVLGGIPDVVRDTEAVDEDYGFAGVGTGGLVVGNAGGEGDEGVGCGFSGFGVHGFCFLVVGGKFNPEICGGYCNC